MSLPERVEDFYADIALIFHWPPAVMDAMALPQLCQWRDMAVQRWNRINAPDAQ